VVNKVKKAEADHFISDCPMAAEQIAQGLEDHDAENPMGLLRQAYGI
jgi:glycerol-3-phosphate dehydrogenase subunit C